jgi:predicted nuclease of predicted toxin-antitoxin system
MRFKLDENLGRSALVAFTSAGHDVSTVHLQQLDGAPDDKIFAVYREESRALVTYDLDFANPLDALAHLHVRPGDDDRSHSRVDPVH